jgi:hypothetical protein
MHATRVAGRASDGTGVALANRVAPRRKSDPSVRDRSPGPNGSPTFDEGMKVRFHFLAGLLALLALTATAVEGLWASTHRAEMGTRTIAAASARMDGPSAPVAPDCPAEMAHAHPSCQGGGNPDAPQCPSMPLGMASSCMGAVALPVESFPHFEPSPEGTLSLRSPDQTRDLLLALAFFRPPIA